jgi:hypothetical protein
MCAFDGLLYALYIGVGVSMTIHWFSDFVAGAIIGTVIGFTVGNVFKSYCSAPPESPQWQDYLRREDSRLKQQQSPLDSL